MNRSYPTRVNPLRSMFRLARRRVSTEATIAERIVEWIAGSQTVHAARDSTQCQNVLVSLRRSGQRSMPDISHVVSGGSEETFCNVDRRFARNELPPSRHPIQQDIFNEDIFCHWLKSQAVRENAECVYSVCIFWYNLAVVESLIDRAYLFLYFCRSPSPSPLPRSSFSP